MVLVRFVSKRETETAETSPKQSQKVTREVPESARKVLTVDPKKKLKMAFR